jgi:hypothetical protein
MEDLTGSPDPKCRRGYQGQDKNPAQLFLLQGLSGNVLMLDVFPCLAQGRGRPIDSASHSPIRLTLLNQLRRGDTMTATHA